MYPYCLMPDHLHLLLQLGARQWTLGQIMGSLKGFTDKRSRDLGHDGPLWQENLYDHIVRRSEDGHEIARYILNNPMRKDLVETSVQYPYSGSPDPI